MHGPDRTKETDFAKLWADKNYKLIVKIAKRLLEKIIQEDDKLFELGEDLNNG